MTWRFFCGLASKLHPVHFPSDKGAYWYNTRKTKMTDLTCPIVGLWTVYNNDDKDFLVQKIIAKVERGYYLTQVIAPQAWAQIAMTLIHISKLSGENRIFCDSEDEAKGWVVARQLRAPPGLPS
jgi:hypothetical protein